MALLNNTPNTGYLYVQGLVISYENKIYSINNIYTNNKYIYFNKNNPNNLVTTNIRKLDNNLCFIIKNINGNGYILDNKDITLTFDSFDNNNIINKINNIKKDNKTYKQKLEQINNNIEDLSDEYKTTKTFDEIKEELNTSIINCSSLLTSLKISFNTYLSDKKFTKDEKNDVDYRIEEIQTKFVKTLASADALVDLKLKEEQIDVSATTQYQTLLTTLLSQMIEEINIITKNDSEDVGINDIVPITSDIDTIINTLSNLKNACNELKFLGAGATISDEVYNANLRIDNILENMNELQASLVNSFNKENQRIQEFFDENQRYSNKIVVLTNEIMNKGDSLTSSQYSTLTQYTTVMKNSLNSIKSTYQTYYNNNNIDNNNKQLLKNSYNAFETKHKALTDLIENDLHDLEYDKTERNNFSVILAEYRSARSGLKAQLSHCVTLVDNATLEVNLKQIQNNLNNEITNVRNLYNGLEKRVQTIEEKLNNITTTQITEG